MELDLDKKTSYLSYHKPCFLQYVDMQLNSPRYH